MLLRATTFAFLTLLAVAGQPTIAQDLRYRRTAAGRVLRSVGWRINKLTRPVGKVLETVLPLRLVEYQRPAGCHRCFIAQTPISLPGGATCPINELRVGQVVLGWNPATGALDTARVEGLAAVVHDSLRQLTFADGRTVTATADHPFWVKGKGWASLTPVLTAARYDAGPVQQLRPDDMCLVLSTTAAPESVSLQKVTSLTKCGVPTYTITRLSRGRVFFANGVAVGVEELRAAGF